MIDRIIEFSGRNKYLVFILVGFAVAAGILALRGRWWIMAVVGLPAVALFVLQIISRFL